ncbi:ATP phosphoribosyltransferase regulatory subunit [Algirhabdus cladophorae]|uniref:ATP phosphoribosyltransferase regulatory subunit n=1 Tax=Algirhabdus cladophorae TaxID=3377108 RepID=UPI003B847AE4
MTTPAYQNKATEILQAFEAKGALRVEANVLQPAGALLDLYGEDIRARAYITQDALRGEQMLRPDFTVPVVQMHMKEGADPARYTYAGRVFRRQENDPDRANEYLQVGYEVFDRDNSDATDAEVFALIEAQLDGVDVVSVTGDIGILTAAVKGLKTTDDRKEALLRHIWRPRRFKALLDRFGGRSAMPPSRENLLARAYPFAAAAPMIGLRRRSEISKRITALHADAKADPISGEEVALLEALLAIKETLPNAISQLANIAVDMPSIDVALETMRRRSDALAALGVAADTLPFEASFGRTIMEYYDGFVFGFRAAKRPDLPYLASGGRYDALCHRLGQGRAIPAVGGVIRPGLLVDLLEAGQ